MAGAPASHGDLRLMSLRTPESLPNAEPCEREGERVVSDERARRLVGSPVTTVRGDSAPDDGLCLARVSNRTSVCLGVRACDPTAATQRGLVSSTGVAFAALVDRMAGAVAE